MAILSNVFNSWQFSSDDSEIYLESIVCKELLQGGALLILNASTLSKYSVTVGVIL